MKFQTAAENAQLTLLISSTECVSKTMLKLVCIQCHGIFYKDEQMRNFVFVLRRLIIRTKQAEGTGDDKA